MKLTIYSDGACSGNPGEGGYAAIILMNVNDNITQEVIGGYDAYTTNNRMELFAIIKTLENLPIKYPMINNHVWQNNTIIFTDSSHVVNGYHTWSKNWKKNQWKTSSGSNVLNQDLWQRLCVYENLNIQWIKGHSNSFYNNQVDLLAKSYIKNSRFST